MNSETLVIKYCVPITSCTGSERAGQRATAIQTLFGTAQLNGLDP